MVAVLFGLTGWEGVLTLSVVMSMLGAAAVYRAQVVAQDLDKNRLHSTSAEC